MKEKLETLYSLNTKVLNDYDEFATSNLNWDIHAYVNMKYDLNAAIAFGKFYFPEFIEIKGCVILKSRFDRHVFEDWYSEFSGNISEIEKMCNLYEIADFFHINSSSENNNKVFELGKILVRFYELNLKELFPDKNFTVNLFREKESLFVTFFQKTFDKG